MENYLHWIRVIITNDILTTSLFQFFSIHQFNFCLTKTALCIPENKFCVLFFEKCLFDLKVRFAVEKEEKFFGVVSIFIVAIKKMLVIQFLYMKTV